MVERLSFALVPEDGRVPMSVVEDAMHQVTVLLRGIERAQLMQPKARTRTWYLEPHPALAKVPTFDLVAVTGYQIPGKRILPSQALVTGVRQLNTNKLDGPPPSFTEQEMENLRNLKERVLQRGVKEIPFWKTETGPRAIVGSAIDKQVERALRPAVSAFGSVQGILGSVKAYGQHYFSVWDDFSGYAIRCYFEPDRLDEVKSNLTKHVSIGGWVSYFADGRPKSVSRINQISELRPLGWKSGKDYWGAMRDLSTGSG